MARDFDIKKGKGTTGVGKEPVMKGEGLTDGFNVVVQDDGIWNWKAIVSSLVRFSLDPAPADADEVGGFTETDGSKIFTVNQGAGKPLIKLEKSAVSLLEITQDGAIDITAAESFRLPRLTAVQASALTPLNGMFIYVTDTDATFTAAGFWGYDEGVWTKK